MLEHQKKTTGTTGTTGTHVLTIPLKGNISIIYDTYMTIATIIKGL